MLPDALRSNKRGSAAHIFARPAAHDSEFFSCTRIHPLLTAAISVALLFVFAGGCIWLSLRATRDHRELPFVRYR